MQGILFKWQEKGKRKKTHLDKDEILNALLKLRGIASGKRDEFLFPRKPQELDFKEFSLKEKTFGKLVERLKKTKKDGEKIIIYGDYDTDGVCATAILWETLFALGFDVLPYIPERFSEGYGINPDTLEKLKLTNPNLGLIITVDNGIVAYKALKVAKNLGIDVVVCDHHHKGEKPLESFAVIHTEVTSGSGISWFVAEKIREHFKFKANNLLFGDGLELAALGVLADQIPLLGVNRSIVKYGLKLLNTTQRPGLLSLYRKAGIKQGEVGTYEVNYIISPRINATGRLTHAMDSLRLICTKDEKKAMRLAHHLDQVNRERQEKLDSALKQAKSRIERERLGKVLILADESYHEGVIGLVASKLVEEYFRPTVVISKGKKLSKASARSISGFNIIENLKKVEFLFKAGGGHPMAAGFTIRTDRIEIFTQEFVKTASQVIDDEMLTRKLNLDLELRLEEISFELLQTLALLEPTGIGNPKPLFVSKKVELMDAKKVGEEGKHLKLIVGQEGSVFSCVAFGFGEYFSNLYPGMYLDIVYSLEKNSWNGNENLELRIKDFKKH